MQRIAQSLNKSKRTIQYALQFYKKYPDLSLVPEGKNISWYKICNKYLPLPKEDKKPLPQGKYSVIYADPPWPYPNRNLAKRYGGAVCEHYPVMPIEKICNLEVKKIAADNSVLFLWVATNFLEDSFKVIESWGFEYKTQMVWVKTPTNLPSVGYYVRSHHELLLIATRGSYLPKSDAYVSSVVEAPRKEHSKKPEIFYGVIEKLYPQDKYLELFARQKRQNWDCWGNEVDQQESCKQNLSSTEKKSSKIENEKKLNIDTCHSG